MYLFSRQRIANPASGRAATAFAMEATQRVRDLTGRDISLWMAVFSGSPNRYAFTTMLDHLDELETTFDKLGADSGYGDFVEKGAAMFLGTAEDAVLQIVHGVPATEAPAYTTVTIAEARPDALVDGIELGVAIAQKATEITGIATSFGHAVTGPYAGCVWFTGVPDLSTLETSQAALMGNADWLALLGRAGDCYQAGARTEVWRRLV
jgi:hypothetical protein